jgi:hypothetical protein
MPLETEVGHLAMPRTVFDLKPPSPNGSVLLLEEDRPMSTFDFSPLYRTVVGFDRLASLIDTAQRLDGAQGYPPYNIEQSIEDENAYSIELAARASPKATSILK